MHATTTNIHRLKERAEIVNAGLNQDGLAFTVDGEKVTVENEKQELTNEDKTHWLSWFLSDRKFQIIN
jgi:hypothetical protein